MSRNNLFQNCLVIPFTIEAEQEIIPNIYESKLRKAECEIKALAMQVETWKIRCAEYKNQIKLQSKQIKDCEGTISQQAVIIAELSNKLPSNSEKNSEQKIDSQEDKKIDEESKVIVQQIVTDIIDKAIVNDSDDEFIVV
jgi:hypothetical protein